MISTYFLWHFIFKEKKSSLSNYPKKYKSITNITHFGGLNIDFRPFSFPLTFFDNFPSQPLGVGKKKYWNEL